MRLRKKPSDAGHGEAGVNKRHRRERGGWGPFTGGQLTTVIVALVLGVVAYPFAAGAASAIFTSSSNTIPAMNAANTAKAGTGVQGTGKKYGVYSNGPLGVATGKALNCAGCVSGGDLARSAKTYCSGYPHMGVDWSIPGSTPGHGCDLIAAGLSNANLSNANLTNADLHYANLIGADTSYATLVGADLSNANLYNADVTNANLSNANLNRATLIGADLSNANLSNAVGTPSSSSGAVWSNTTCPDRTNSNNDGGTCVGHGF